MNAPAGTEIQHWVKAIAEAEIKFNEIAIPDGNVVRFHREAVFAMQRIGADATMQKCEFASIRNAIIHVASVGLTLNPAMKLAYLVPRADNKSGTTLCCLDISYIGLVKIATDSGGVLAVAATLVRANDGFVYRGPFEPPLHNFDPFADEKSRGEIIGVYTTAKLASGVTQIDAIGREGINKIRSMSKAKSGPWFDWFDEMAKKAAIKRASKLWPRTERLATAEQILNEHQGNETTIDGETGEVIPNVQMPTPKSKSAPKRKAPEAPPADEPAPDQSEVNARPLSPAQARILRAMMTRLGTTEDALLAAFPGRSLDAQEGAKQFTFGEFPAVQKWIAEHAAEQREVA